MRKQHPPDRAYRVRRDFLLLPKRIGGETRWWEWACWLEKYLVASHAAAWLSERWLGELEYKELNKLGLWYVALSRNGWWPSEYPWEIDRLVGKREYIEGLSGG